MRSVPLNPGRWIAYASNETSTFQIYVRAFPDNGSRWTITSRGGVWPVFSPNRRDLFYRTEDGQVMVASYVVKDNYAIGKRGAAS
jgi:hypothetical protein